MRGLLAEDRLLACLPIPLRDSGDRSTPRRLSLVPALTGFRFHHSCVAAGDFHPLPLRHSLLCRVLLMRRDASDPPDARLHLLSS